ncbi:hypothetical protein FNV43_RR10706 [Rhamnella rubrinervis]|uniref:RRM domain-containing protein n=1 Tax=Rhamnella rubrinervis TaxID=2594499 RepID=A0A8K0H4V7_9ROSA|nr:hypothetical protein FNV43_RR10706 [Rhamnella rubrinervis]
MGEQPQFLYATGRTYFAKQKTYLTWRNNTDTSRTIPEVSYTKSASTTRNPTLSTLRTPGPGGESQEKITQQRNFKVLAVKFYEREDLNMAEGFWNQQQFLLPSAGVLKRPRSDYDLSTSGQPSGHETHSYLIRDNNRIHGGPRAVKDTKTIDSAYDRYLQSAQTSSFTSGEASGIGGVGLGRNFGGGISSRPTSDHAVMSRHGDVVSDLVRNGRNIGFVDQLPVDEIARPGREIVPLPPDASSTLYVEGLPPDSTKREVAHIFRPFVGYKEVRLVSKESKHRGGDPLILCFVDFANPACAATAMSALQGYKMDELDPDSSHLRLQFSRFPGPRSGSGSRGKR